ncbi:hypothetical protein [uncultured Bosea sp.]|uniref:hypothetical protein n=1 Tax=uncultured Bosea sp. TaxID=211457 RepID=UPI0025D0B910|nr:hypothetical protein [uncultured Bosea sp.]
MKILLASTLAAQHDFETRYAPALWALADTLSVILAEVEGRQRRSITLAGEAAARSGKVVTAAGAVIIALQSGDSIRQRLEHAIAGLRLAETLEIERTIHHRIVGTSQDRIAQTQPGRGTFRRYR